MGFNSTTTFLTPVSGATIDIPESDETSRLVLNPLAELATLTINLPSTTRQGAVVSIISTQNVVSLTLGNGTILGEIPTRIDKSKTLSLFYGSSVEVSGWVVLFGNQSIVDWTSNTGNNKILNRPTVPTLISALTNDSGFVNANGVRAAVAPTYNSAPARVLSTNGNSNQFTISTTKAARVYYTINFAWALSNAQMNGVVQLDYSVDGGTNWIAVSSVSQAFTVNITQTGNRSFVLSGEVPANALVRVYRITATNTTVTISRQQEVTY